MGLLPTARTDRNEFRNMRASNGRRYGAEMRCVVGEDGGASVVVRLRGYEIMGTLTLGDLET